MNRKDRRALAAQRRHQKATEDNHEMTIVTLGFFEEGEIKGDDPRALLEWKARHSTALVLMLGDGPQMSHGLTYDELVQYAERRKVDVLLFVLGLEPTRAYFLTRRASLHGDLKAAIAEIEHPDGPGEHQPLFRGLLASAVENRLLTMDLAVQALALEEMNRSEPTN